MKGLCILCRKISQLNNNFLWRVDYLQFLCWETLVAAGATKFFAVLLERHRTRVIFATGLAILLALVRETGTGSR